MGRGMPTLKEFNGFSISMYFEDHNPPHVHVRGSGFAATMRIADAKVMAGDLPARAGREAASWVEKNREMLFARWEELH